MMSLTKLSDLLRRVEADRCLWIDAEDQPVRCTAIASLLNIDRELYRGRRVAISTQDNLGLARCLVALDGLCEAIVLLPDSLDQKSRDALARSAGVEIDIDVENIMASPSPQISSPVDSDAVFETKWILATSGTTGTPKLVQHTLASLTQTAKFDVSAGRDYTWASLYNLTGFAGLQVFLQAWCGGSKFLMSGSSESLPDKLKRFAHHEVTSLSATPTMWRKILMSTESAGLKLRQITLGGEIADSKVLKALLLRFPNAKMTQIYASTEAGVGFSVHDGQVGFPASYLKDPPRGVRLKIVDGRLHLAKDSMQASFVEPSLALVGDDGFVDTGDQVKLMEDRIYFLGRANGTINVGGNKVHPEEIEAWLLSQDEVAEAKVSAMSSSFTGSLVQAEVVAKTGTKVSAPQLRTILKKRCRADLPAYKVPAIIRMVEGIETNDAGKLNRSA